MQISPIFTDTRRDLLYGVRRITHQGGQSAGKTVNILGAICSVLQEGKGLIATVTSMSMPHLKVGAFRDFENHVYNTFRPAIRQVHKTDHIVTFKSGSKLEFKSFETEYDARGPRRDILFINEANTFEYMKFFQLDSRSKQTIIDYNPTIRFWAHDLEGQPGNAKYISWHEHNLWLTKQQHDDIEGIKDPEMWKVYARGLTGNVQGIIYPNWQVIDDTDFKFDNDCFWGIDYGYTNDPTALVKMYRLGCTVFIKECLYLTGASATTIVQILKANGYKSGEPLYSEWDDDMIAQLRDLDIFVVRARKGAGSINAGIIKVGEYDIKYTASSKNITNERKMYIWVRDDKTGKMTNVPVDSYNHLMDAVRYGIYTHFYREPEN